MILIGCAVADSSDRARLLALRISFDICAGAGLTPSLALLTALTQFFANSFALEDLEGLV